MCWGINYLLIVVVGGVLDVLFGVVLMVGWVVLELVFIVLGILGYVRLGIWVLN